MTLTWYRHFERNGGLNQILKRQTSPFHMQTPAHAMAEGDPISDTSDAFVDILNSL
jgi:hypothetical protein